MSSEIEDDHHSYLQLAKNISKLEAKASLVYSYKNIINGFSAWLTPHEAAMLSGIYSQTKKRFHLISCFNSY